MSIESKGRWKRLAQGLVALVVVGLGTMPLEATRAVAVDLSGIELDFSSSKRVVESTSPTPTQLNGYSVYENVASVGGVQVDARVTTTELTATISDYDDPGSASGNAKYFQIDGDFQSGERAAFRFDFFDHDTGLPVTLENVLVTSIDLDKTGRQYTEFSGFQSYVLSTDTRLVPY
jgi:hypothetical protein